MIAIWRMLLFAGLISVFIGILYVTSFLEANSDGINIWGYFILFWGIFVILSSLNRIAIIWILKGFAALGIVFHGSLACYWLLFLDTAEAKGNADIVYTIASIMVTFICILILGTKVIKTGSKTLGS